MRLTHLIAYTAAAGVAATPLTLAAPASATASGTASAFGVSASGLVTIPPTPSVSSSSYRPVRRSLAELPANPLVDLGVLRVSARAGHARADVVDLRVAKAALSARLISATCRDGRGSSHLVKAVLGGRRLAAHAAPNSALAVPVQGLGTVSVVLNKQVRGADGSLTVTAIALRLPVGGQTVDISSVTCGPSGESAPPPSEAPRPEPVPSDLPVTG